jgi:hypothetical protein
MDYSGYDMDLSDQGARALGSLVRLTHLGVGGVVISDEGVRALCSLTALTHLDLNSSTMSKEGVKLLTSFTALTNLSLEASISVGDEGVIALAALTALTGLQLNGTGVGDEGVKLLAALTALTADDGCRSWSWWCPSYAFSEIRRCSIFSCGAAPTRVCPTSFVGFPPTSHDPERCSTTPPSWKGCRTSFQAPRCPRGPCA